MTATSVPVFANITEGVPFPTLVASPGTDNALLGRENAVTFYRTSNGAVA